MSPNLKIKPRAHSEPKKESHSDLLEILHKDQFKRTEFENQCIQVRKLSQELI